MTKFGIVRPHRPSFEIAEHPHLYAALRAAGLPANEVDHGAVGVWSGFRETHHGNTTVIQVDEPLPPGGGVGIVVWEWSLMSEPAYWSLGQQLCNGPAVLYGVDDHGETVDLDARRVPPIRWFDGGVPAVEAAINEGLVERPEVRVNGALHWRWTGRVDRVRGWHNL